MCNYIPPQVWVQEDMVMSSRSNEELFISAFPGTSRKKYMKQVTWRDE